MRITLIAAVALLALTSGAMESGVVPLPFEPSPQLRPVFRPSRLDASERPVLVESEAKIVADNGLFRRIETTITFTNPNSRVFEGELEFPIPEGASVCGYRLEVNGSMVPGVVVAKEEARVAFENEMRKGVDPGIVEHVKGKVWKTRIYPLMCNTPRKAQVDYVIGATTGTKGANGTVVERCGDEVFVGEWTGVQSKVASVADRLRNRERACIYWDASMSRLGKVAADRNLLECLSEQGNFRLVVFRNVIEKPQAFTRRADLLAAIDALDYDGGTCLEAVLKALRSSTETRDDSFVFSDEYTEPKPRAIRVSKLAADEKPPAEPQEGNLLATAWAANRVEDLADDAAAHKAELVEIGRKYGVASPVTSLIVLESLQQYKTYGIEPPKCMGFYEEWKRWRAAEDDPIAAEKARADHRQQLLTYWEERVKWWNAPVPKRNTPSSGLFADACEEMGETQMRGERTAAAVRASARRRAMERRAMERRSSIERCSMERRSMAMDSDAMDTMADASMSSSRMATGAMSAEMSASFDDDDEGERSARDSVSRSGSPMAKPSVRTRGASAEAASPASAAQVKIAAWNPAMPYLKAIEAAGKENAYAEYLKQREVHGQAPAFYLDCASWFFKAKELTLAIRILSNLSEMKLEDVALWRTMGWRLREAGAYEEAIATFRHVLEMRGEEPQSKRDLALVLTEAGKAVKDASRLSEAARLLHEATFEPSARRSARRGNDFQTSVIALEELNGLYAWCAANGVKLDAPTMDAAFRRDLPLALRITLSWDVDETDVDLHVLEPDGEEAYYGHRRTSSGGFMSEDVTTGYGPEEYLCKQSANGVYRILAHYFASHRQALTGAATVTATVYTDWGTAREKREILSFRLDKPRDKQQIGEVKTGVE